MYELTKSGDATLNEEFFPEAEESDGDESLVTVGEDDDDDDDDERDEEDKEKDAGDSDDDDSDIDEYESKIRSKPMETTEAVEKIKSRGKGALQAFKTALSCSRSSSQELDDDRNDQVFNKRGSLSADSYDDYSDSSEESW